MTEATPRGLAAALILLLTTAVAFAEEPASWPDSFVGRLEALALLESLNADLLAHDSATLRSNAGAPITGWPIPRASSPSG